MPFIFIAPLNCWIDVRILQKDQLCILLLFIRSAEKLSGRDLGALTEVTQSVNVQKQKLDQLVTIVNELLDRQDTDKWTMECKF